MKNGYARVSTGTKAAVASTGSTNRRILILAAVCCVLLLAIYAHNLAFYSSLHPLMDKVLGMEGYVLQTQKELREDVFELLHNISTIFQGKAVDEELAEDVAVEDLTESAEYKEYLLMKERNERLEDEIKWLVMRSNVRKDDPVKQATYELEHQQSQTAHLTTTLQAKVALLAKIESLQKAADATGGNADSATDDEMKKLQEHLQTLQMELANKKQQLATQRRAYHEKAIEARRVDEAMGKYMDDGHAVGKDIVEMGANVTKSVEIFAAEQRAKVDDWDRGPEPLLCYSLVDEAAFQPRPEGGDPLAVMAHRRWSKVCGRYILFAESRDNIPPEITKPVTEKGGYGLVLGVDLVLLTTVKHSTPLKTWQKFAYAVLFMSQHIGCDGDDKPLSPMEGVSNEHNAPCLHLEKHEWFVHLDVQTYFFRANLYYLLARLAEKHASDWLTVSAKEALDFRTQGEYLGLPNFSEHIAINSGFFFLLSKPAIDHMTTALRESKKRGTDESPKPRCSWSKGHEHSFLSTCVDGCASHPDLVHAQRLCEEMSAHNKDGAACGGVIQAGLKSYQLRAGNQPQFLASSSEVAYVMKCTAAQKEKVLTSTSSYPSSCGLTKENVFDRQLGNCLFDLGIFLRKTSDMYGREAFAIVNPYRIAEIENYPVLEKYFDGRFNENFGTPQNHFSPFLVATYMGFEPAPIAGCAATLFDRVTTASATAISGTVPAEGTPTPKGPTVDLTTRQGIVLLEEQLPEVKRLLDMDEGARDCTF